MATNTAQYVFGSSKMELERLERQGAFLKPPTRAALVRAGIEPGMRVLDFGCGGGDVSLLAAELVGAGGEVIGVDRSPDALNLARARAAARGVTNVQFQVGDEEAVERLCMERPFDALVGRLVLIHQPDPVGTVCRLASCVRAGGVIALVEIDMEGEYWAVRPNPFLEQVWRWANAMASNRIFREDVGRCLATAMRRLGATNVQVIREGRLLSSNDEEANQWLTDFASAIEPAVRRFGAARAADRPIAEVKAAVQADPASAEDWNIGAFLVSATGTLPPAHGKA